VDLARGLTTTQLGAVNGDKKSRTDGDGAYVRRNGIKVKTDLGKHALRRYGSGRILWKKKHASKQINRACFKRLALRRVPVLMIERGTRHRSQLFGNKAGPVFRGAVPKRDHAAYQGPASLRLSSMSFFVIVVLRLTQMPWVSSTSGANAEAGGTLGGEGWCNQRPHGN
jgi:hypothetical protein